MRDGIFFLLTLALLEIVCLTFFIYKEIELGPKRQRQSRDTSTPLRVVKLSNASNVSPVALLLADARQVFQTRIERSKDRQVRRTLKPGRLGG